MPLPTVKSLGLSDNILTGYALDIANENRDYITDLIPPINQASGVDMADGNAFAGEIIRSKLDSFFLQTTDTANLEVAWGQELPMFKGVELDPLSWRSKKFAMQGYIPRELYLVTEARREDNVRYCLGPVVENVKQAREIQLINVLKNWSNNTALTYDWTTANGNPSGDIMNALTHVAKYKDPDTVILGYEAALACMGNVNWRAEMPHTMFRQGMPIDELAETIRSRLAVKQVIISRARYNSSTTSTPSIDGIFGDRCWVGRLEMQPDDSSGGNHQLDRSYKMTQGAIAQNGTSFLVRSSAFVRIVPEDIRCDAWYKDSDQSVHFSCSCHQDVEVAYAQLGYLLTNCA